MVVVIHPINQAKGDGHKDQVRQQGRNNRCRNGPRPEPELPHQHGYGDSQHYGGRKGAAKELGEHATTVANSAVQLFHNVQAPSIPYFLELKHV